MPAPAPTAHVLVPASLLERTAGLIEDLTGEVEAAHKRADGSKVILEKVASERASTLTQRCVALGIVPASAAEQFRQTMASDPVELLKFATNLLDQFPAPASGQGIPSTTPGVATSSQAARTRQDELWEKAARRA